MTNQAQTRILFGAFFGKRISVSGNVRKTDNSFERKK